MQPDYQTRPDHVWYGRNVHIFGALRYISCMYTIGYSMVSFGSGAFDSSQSERASSKQTGNQIVYMGKSRVKVSQSSPVSFKVTTLTSGSDYIV